jgi:hypothetical protein
MRNPRHGRWLVQLLACWWFCLGVVSAQPQSIPAPTPAAATTLPTGAGLPLVVRVAVFFIEVHAIDDVSGHFEATLDLRVLWRDNRLKFCADAVPGGFREFRGQAARERLAKLWTPEIVLDNLDGEASEDSHGVREFADGRVEWMRRVHGRFQADFDVQRFPFDHQRLAVALVSRRDPLTQVQFEFRQADLDFSRLARGTGLEGWSLGQVMMRRDPLVGWHGQQHARVEAVLAVARDPASSVGTIFIPLLASLLIPLLALWLNASAPGGDFRIEAFELTNVLIGGLFALIALNFTVNAAFPMLARDNPVARLFSLNYVLLGVSLAINVLIFRYRLPARWWGAGVQEALFAWLIWAVPTIALVTAAAIVWTAMA